MKFITHTSPLLACKLLPGLLILLAIGSVNHIHAQGGRPASADEFSLAAHAGLLHVDPTDCDHYRMPLGLSLHYRHLRWGVTFGLMWNVGGRDITSDSWRALGMRLGTRLYLGDPTAPGRFYLSLTGALQQMRCEVTPLGMVYNPSPSDGELPLLQWGALITTTIGPGYERFLNDSFGLFVQGGVGRWFSSSRSSRPAMAATLDFGVKWRF